MCKQARWHEKFKLQSLLQRPRAAQVASEKGARRAQMITAHESSTNSYNSLPVLLSLLHPLYNHTGAARSTAKQQTQRNSAKNEGHAADISSATLKNALQQTLQC
jgi:hypothetical protein